MEENSSNNQLADLLIQNGVVTETNPPEPPSAGDFFIVGEPTIGGNRLTRGITKDTSLEKCNNELDHVCDFKFKLKMDISIAQGELKNLIVAARTSLESIYSSDAISPIVTYVKSVAEKAKAVIRDLEKIKEDIMDQVKKVKEYIDYANKMIQWLQELIQSGITYLKNIAQQCMSDLTSSLKESIGLSDVNVTSITETISNVQNNLTKITNMSYIEDTVKQLSGSSVTLYNPSKMPW